MRTLFFMVLLQMFGLGARAAVGLMSLPATDAVGEVTVFYPTAAVAHTLQRGPFSMRLAQDAAPIKGNGTLIVISHGSTASPWVYFDIARALVDAGFVVAMPEHHGDNHRDASEPGPPSWKRRPLEVSAAIDVVARHPAFAPLLQFERVGMYGMSAGGTPP